MRKILIYILIILISSGSPGCKSQKTVYRIGIDPYFYPLSIHRRTEMVTGFSLELLEKIGLMENVHFIPIQMNWNNLLYGLDKKSYEAALSFLQPYLFNEKKYRFSNPYFSVGLILLVEEKFDIFSLEDLSNKELIIPRSPDLMQVLERYPKIYKRFYNSPEDGFNVLIQGKTSGAVMENYIASGFLREPYPGKVVAIPQFITNKGIYLLTTTGKNEKILKIFNRGLQKMKEGGEYDDLVKKWNLDFIQ
ncbi:MAG: substrate-binding periplasmic protein [Chlamydiales bacterium]